MKKKSIIIYTLLIAAAILGCAQEEGAVIATPTESKQPEASVVPGNSAIENTSRQSAAQSSQATVQTQVTLQDEDNSQTKDKTDDSNILVAYFSATNTTKGVAEKLANGLSADIYRITPEQPYTAADLDWNDSNSRSTLEMNDPAARPAISGAVENMEQYDIVFLGYPIWWYDAPRIMSTFVESYDFSGKTIVPFCTSGGSGIGSSASNLEKLTNGAEWLSGTRFNGGASEQEIMDWVAGLGVEVKAQ